MAIATAALALVWSRSGFSYGRIKSGVEDIYSGRVLRAR
jgi:hypothetical protein